MHKNLRLITGAQTPQAITSDLIPPSLRLLVLAPHPDDFDAIGVTLKRLHSLGNHIDVVVTQTGSGVEDGYQGGLSLQEKAACREKEQRASLRFFGLADAHLTFLDLARDESDQLTDSAANLEAIFTCIAHRKPDIVFLPHGNDTNHAHRTMFKLADQAARCYDNPLTLCLNQDSKTIAMRTDLYQEFDGNMGAWKAELLRFHDSQQQRNLNTRKKGFDERVLEVNKEIARALGIRAPYAEAFEVRHYP